VATAPVIAEKFVKDATVMKSLTTLLPLGCVGSVGLSALTVVPNASEIAISSPSPLVVVEILLG
jgi:hypothetical protein